MDDGGELEQGKGPEPPSEPDDEDRVSGPTPLDSPSRGLRFRLGPIPITIHFSFLFVALLGWGPFSGLEIAAWTVAVFFAVLLHELGHALTARRFGADPVTITLFAFGGFTTYPIESPLSPGRRFVVTAAGSAIGILVGGSLMILGSQGLFSETGNLLSVFLTSFVFASLIWGVLNWVPIRPLDGGQMTYTMLEQFLPGAADLMSKIISVIAGGVAIVFAIAFEDLFAAVFVGLIVFSGLRSPPTSERGDRLEQSRPKGPAVAMAMSLVGMWAVSAFVLIYTFGSPTGVPVTELAVGDCVDLPDTGEVLSVEPVPCDQPHAEEVFEVASMGDALGESFPTPFALEGYAAGVCLDSFESYVGSSFETSSLEVGYLSPSEGSWSRGDRQLTCILYRTDGQKMTGSMEGSGL